MTSTRWATACLAAIALVSVVVLIVIWWQHPSPDSLQFEAAKTAMQVLAVGGLGGLGSLAVASFQEAADKAARQREAAEAARQADAAAAAAQRAREDELVRDLFGQTLTTYNRVKRTRRLLAADTADGTALTRAVYDRHASALIDDQLEFERFKRQANSIPIPRLMVAHRVCDRAPCEELTEAYLKIEKHLNRVIREHREKRPDVPDTGSGVPLPELLRGFLDHKFVEEVADQIDVVVRVLNKALFAP